jgi:hypothetical protein
MALLSDHVIDLDIIRSEIDASFRQWSADTDAHLLNKALRVRNQRLASLSRVAHRAWFIVSAPYKAEREWWQSALGGDVVLLDPGLAECKRRAIQRGTPLAIKGAYDWYEKSRRSWSRNKRIEFTQDGRVVW